MSASSHHSRRWLSGAILALTAAGATAQQPGEGLTPIAAAPPAPEFVLTDLDGRVHRLSEYRDKVVVINFWASWCPPCRAEMPSMERAWRQLRNDAVTMLAINVGENEDSVFQFTADYPVSFTLLLDQDSAVTDAWPVRGLPTTIVLDPEGRMRYQAIGGRAWDEPALLDSIRALSR